MGNKIIDKMTIRGKRHAVFNEKGYPLDELEFKRIRRMRQQLIFFKKAMLEYKRRIEVKKKFLEEIYDNVLKDIDKYEQSVNNRQGVKKVK